VSDVSFGDAAVGDAADATTAEADADAATLLADAATDTAINANEAGCGPTDTIQHCGQCDVACDGGSHADASCASGMCFYTCNPGWIQCGSSPCDTNTTMDPSNCGACGAVCDSGACNAHSDGIGQTWYDCAATGTYDLEEAMAACKHATDGGQCAATNCCGNQADDTVCSTGSCVACWHFDGTSCGNVSQVLDCYCDPTGLGTWN
jgi:hypothetical protein